MAERIVCAPNVIVEKAISTGLEDAEKSEFDRTRELTWLIWKKAY